MANDLSWLLQQFLSRIHRARFAVVLSVDGVKQHWAGLDSDDADRFAAAAAPLCGLTGAIGGLLSSRRTFHQVSLEFPDAYFFVIAASTNSVLAVAADSDVDVTALSFEMTHLCTQVNDHLGTSGRAPSAPALEPR